MDLLNCCFNMLNINPRRLATAFHSLYQEVHTISPLSITDEMIQQYIDEQEGEPVNDDRFLVYPPKTLQILIICNGIEF